MMNQTENAIQSAVRDYLRFRGWFVIRNQQSLGSHRGLADLTAVKDGRVVWIEVKTRRGKLSEHQERFRDDVLQHGGEYIVVRSIEDVQKWELLQGA